MDSNLLDMIKEIINKNNTLSLVQISFLLHQNYNIICPKSTVHQYLIKNGFVNKTPKIKPLLTQQHLNDREKLGNILSKFLLG